MKLFIFGIVASGKTTLARKLSAQYGVPHYEGDCIAHGVDDTGAQYKRTPEQQRARIAEIDRQGSWIIEGTYRESQRELFDLADRILFLDPPLGVRKRRILLRFLKQKLGMEPCHYHPDFHMLRMMYRWTADFEAKRDWFEALLSQYRDKVVRLKR